MCVCCRALQILERSDGSDSSKGQTLILALGRLGHMTKVKDSGHEPCCGPFSGEVGELSFLDGVRSTRGPRVRYPPYLPPLELNVPLSYPPFVVPLDVPSPEIEPSSAPTVNLIEA